MFIELGWPSLFGVLALSMSGCMTMDQILVAGIGSSTFSLVLFMLDVYKRQLVGVCTDICVISNALLIKAYLPEVKITVDSHCCLLYTSRCV